VTPDYPHEEVAARGVNHFPDGVFQRCRKIVQQEKDAERERLRKARRKRPSGSATPGAESSPISSPVPTRSVELSLVAPAAVTGSIADQEAMWLLEQQFDIESPGVTRPQSRAATVVNTPFLTPSPARVHPVATNAPLEVGMDSPIGAHSPVVRPSPSSETSRPSTGFGSSSRVVPASAVYTTTLQGSTGGGTGSNRSSGVAVAPSPHRNSGANAAYAAATAAYAAATAAGAVAGSSARHSGSGASSPARPFSSLEQQMMYQQGATAVRRGSGGGAVSPSLPASPAGSPSPSRALLGSPAKKGRMVSWRDPNFR
jgi:hypothetical protein